MDTIFFVYINGQKKVAAYSLIKPSYTDFYVQGFSPTVDGYRTFRKDRFIKSFDNLEEAKKYSHDIGSTLDASQYISPQKRHNSHRKFDAPIYDGAFEVCFTGFKKAEKERLTQTAVLASMIVRSDVTVNLHVLCYGYNAGPKKMELARVKGSMVLNEEQFISFIDTGEIPDIYIDATQ